MQTIKAAWNASGPREAAGYRVCISVPKPCRNRAGPIMVKKLMPVMAAPDISGGMSSLIWGYIKTPVALKKPKAKNNRANTKSGMSAGIMAMIMMVSTMPTEPATITHLRVLKNLSDNVPQIGEPEIMPTFKSRIRLPVVKVDNPMTSIK